MNLPQDLLRTRVRNKRQVTARGRDVTAIVVAFVSLLGVPHSWGTDYYWDPDVDASGSLGGTGSWNTTSTFWRLGSSSGALQVWPNTGSNNDAFLTGTAGTLTLTTGISVNDISVSPSSGTTYTIASPSQILTLNGLTQPVLTVASGSTLAISAGIAGASGFTKTGAGTLLISGTSNALMGGVALTEGTIQTPGSLASTAWRNNELALGSTAIFTRSDSTTGNEFRVGAISGSGKLDLPANSLSILALSNKSFSGNLVIGGNGLTVRGTGTQSLSSSATTFAAPITVGSQAGITLLGDGAVPASVTGLTLRDRGSFTLDKSALNLANRLGDSMPVTMNGGTFALSGNAGVSASSETVGNLTIGFGRNLVLVNHNVASSGTTTLNFSTLVKADTGSAVNFVSTGGPFVTSGTGSRITFTSAAALPNGFAVVNGSDFASYSSGILPVTSANYSGTGTVPSSTDLNLTGTWSPSGNITLNSLKITPSASGQSLSLGSNTFNAPGILLNDDSPHDFTISGGTLGTGTTARYFHIWNPERTLTVGSALGAGGSITKAGDGFLAFSGTTDLVNYPSSGNIYLLGGTLRASPGVNFGTKNVLYLRGGVFEIANGATFTRSAVGNTGGVSFDGSGGFSAFGSNAIVNLGGLSPSASLTWGAGNFLKDGDAFLFGSTQSDARLTFQNPINLDGTGYTAREFRVFDNPNSSADVTRLAGSLTSSASTDLLKTGAGTLELAAVNSNFLGNTIVHQGTLAVSSGNALADGGTIVMGNILAATLQLNANETIGGLSGGGALGGNVNLQASTLTVGDQRDSTFSGTITGVGGKLDKRGSGILTLAQANTYTGGTTITEGAIRLGSDKALPVAANPDSGYALNLSGGTLMLNGHNAATLDAAGKVTERLGNLTLTANSTIDFELNNPNQNIAFSGFTPNTSILTITGWTGSSGSSVTGGHILFASAGWDSGKLSSIVFRDLSGNLFPSAAWVYDEDVDYMDITPVPEPRPAWAAFALAGFVVVREIWRRWK